MFWCFVFGCFLNLFLLLHKLSLCYDFQLYEPKAQTDSTKNLRIVREHIKRACHHTGILGKPSVLLVHEDLGTECLQDVAALMAEGNIFILSYNHQWLLWKLIVYDMQIYFDISAFEKENNWFLLSTVVHVFINTYTNGCINISSL